LPLCCGKDEKSRRILSSDLPKQISRKAPNENARDVKNRRQKQTRRQASHPAPHRSWSFEIRLPAARSSGTILPVRQLSRRIAAFTGTGCNARFGNRARNLRVPGSPTRSKSVKWRRPQLPGQAEALTRARMSPALTLESASCCRRHRNHRSTDLKALT
jgi:hypothetical protein